MNSTIIKGVIFAFFVSLITSVSGQIVGGGFLIGTNFSQVDGDNHGGYSKLGLSVGGLAFFQLSPKTFLQPEIQFNQLGARKSNAFLFFHSRFNYINVPVNVLVRILEKKRNTFALSGGINTGYLLSTNEGDNKNKNDVSHRFKKYDLGFTVGVEYGFLENLAISIRHGISLVPVMPNVRWYAHRFFNLSLRVQFHNGKIPSKK